jgi:branched-chain amino acid transport system ATP-binding protein
MEEVFELFPVLRQRRLQLARTLSGGEQQMLAIGRAMMARPRLLMFDEPSLGLAPLLVRSIFDSIRRLKALGLTILLVEQNIRHSLQISDYAYVLETGRVALEGTGQEILKNAYTQQAYLGL